MSQMRVFLRAVVALSFSAPMLAPAQIALDVHTSSSSLSINQNLTYTLTLSSQSVVTFNNVVVDSSFNAAVTLVSATNNFGTAALQGSSVVFQVPKLYPTTNVVMTLVVQPQAAGLLTNTFLVTAPGVSFTNSAITQVYAAVANVGVSLSSETNALVAGDWSEFRVQVANAGPDRAPGVQVTNTLPAGAQFISLSPSSTTVAQSGSQLVYSTGALAAGSNTVFKVRMQVNSAGTNVVSAQVGGANINDNVSSNNMATNQLMVVMPQEGAVTAGFVSAQIFNPQTGLMEETVRVTNSGPSKIAGARVLFSDLNQLLFNATGTNDGRPYVALTRSLAAGGTADLLVEYFAPVRSPFPDPTLLAWAVPAYVPAAPVGVTGISMNALRLADKTLLLEFPAVSGKTYQIIYSDDVTFSNSVRALPSITATADRVQWIDAGPPKTGRRPDEVATRFYEVIPADP